MDFLWRKVSDKEKEEIKEQAKQIMQSFGKQLEKVKLPEAKGVQRADQTRKETNAFCKKEFREFFFENAKKIDKIDGEFIKAEKGSWKR